ncbi:hypothetical protein JHU04_000860 [Brenneria sp. 4F2]|nr:hypothetical protein [Brenneria bubanii]
MNYVYVTKKPFSLGNTFSNPNEVLFSESDGEFYRWEGSLPKAVPAGSTPESTGGIGNDAWKSVGDAALRSDLKKNTGAGLVGTSSGKTVQEIFASSAYVSILEFIPAENHEYLTDRNASLKHAGDLSDVITSALKSAHSSGKALVFPQGYYWVSKSVEQPADSAVYGTGRNTWLVAMDNFSGDQIWSWPSSGSAQPRIVLRDMCFHGNGQFIGGFSLLTGCHTSEISGLMTQDCYGWGALINPVYVNGSGRDIVNLTVDKIFIVNCGSVNHRDAFDVELNAESGAWTDGTVRDVDISITEADPTEAIGPRSLNISTVGRAMFNVTFDRFFTSARMNTHFRMQADTSLRTTNCSFRQFSGETHIDIHGGFGNTDLPQVDLVNCGSWNTFENMYSHLALNNAGLSISAGESCVFSNWTFTPGRDKSNAADTSGQYLPCLSIGSSCNRLVFRDCSFYGLASTSGAQPWKTAFNTYVNDAGFKTEWQSAEMTSYPLVQYALNYYSQNNGFGKSTNATYQGSGITVSQGDNYALILGYPAVSAASDQYLTSI